MIVNLLCSRSTFCGVEWVDDTFLWVDTDLPVDVVDQQEPHWRNCGSTHLLLEECQPIEMHHQLIQQHKRPMCCIIGWQSLPKYQQGPHWSKCGSEVFASAHCLLQSFPKETGIHSSPKERQLQKCCVSFGKECMNWWEWHELSTRFICLPLTSHTSHNSNKGCGTLLVMLYKE